MTPEEHAVALSHHIGSQMLDWTVDSVEDACVELECDFINRKFVYTGEGAEFEIDEEYCLANLERLQSDPIEDELSNQYQNIRLWIDAYRLILSEIRRIDRATSDGVPASLLGGAL